MNICLFGAGSNKISDEYISIGHDLGEAIARNNHTLVFGGGNDGMMGAVARGAKEYDANVLAIMPEWMNEFEDLFEDYTDIIYTKSMSDRKMEFIENSDLFLITPGGIGTLDEFFEVLTLKKLKVHDKPIVIYNIYHYFDTMLEMLNNMIKDAFIPADDENLFIVTYTLEDTIKYF